MRWWLGLALCTTLSTAYAQAAHDKQHFERPHAYNLLIDRNASNLWSVAGRRFSLYKRSDVGDGETALNFEFVRDCREKTEETWEELIPSQSQELTGWESPKSSIARALYCVVTHPSIQQSVNYFIGSPASGAYAMAMAASRASPQGHIIAPEGNKTKLAAARDLFERMGLAAIVDTGHDTVPDDEVWVAEHLCPPHRPLDLFVADLDCTAPTHLWRNLFRACAPRYFFMGNSGMQYADCEPSPQWFAVSSTNQQTSCRVPCCRLAAHTLQGGKG
jgi:hypothetical protein